MRVLRFDLGDYRSVNFMTTLGHVGMDLAAINVLFGRNGAGKTNVLGALARLFEFAGNPHQLQRLLRPKGSQTPDDDYFGNLVIEFDRWRDDGSLDQEIVWKLLTHPSAHDLFGSLDSSDLPLELEDALAGLTRQHESRCPGTSDIEKAIDLRARAMAYPTDDGSFPDRYLVAQELIGQAVFEVPEGFPAVVSGRFTSEAVDAARRIVDAAAANDIKQWFDDPVRESSAFILDTPPGTVGPIKSSIQGSSLPEIGAAALGLFERLLSGITVLTDRTALSDVTAVIAGSEIMERELHLNLALALVAAGRSPGEQLDRLELDPLVRRVERRANELRPAFVSEAGVISIESAEGRLAITFKENDGQERILADLGAGIARWVAIAVRAAAHEVADATALDNEDKPGSPFLYLIDEPEAHLHLGAVRAIAHWLVERNHEGTGIVLATHSLDMLDLPTQTAEFFLVERDEVGTRLASATRNLIPALRAHASALGISPSDALRLARGVLVVEGLHDEMVIRHYFSGQLEAERILILRLMGMHEALALVELNYLADLGLPIVLLCDNIREELLRRPRLDPNASPEEQQWYKLRALRDNHARLEVVSHGARDVIALLSEEAIRTVASGRGGDSQFTWAIFLASDAGRRGDFKGHLGTALGVKIDPQFISEVLAVSRGAPNGALERAFTSALTNLLS